jgi:hypothetical protein
VKRSEHDERLDEMVDESFPASDPPSYVGGPPVVGEGRSTMDIPGMERKQEEGPVARRIERVTSRLPSDLFLWAGLASAATSLGFMFGGKKQVSTFIATWVPTILLFGVYNKIVKIAGSDRYRPELH